MSRISIVLSSVSAIVLACCASLRDAPLPERPNILWLSVEDMSPWLSCYGDDTVPTPNIDRMSAEGVRFTNAFASSPVCAPARSSLITGEYATRIGTMQMRNNSPSKSAVAKDPEAYRDIPGYEGVPPSFVRCFPELLRAVGYYCTNRSKKDYQFREPVTVWDESSNKAHWKNRAEGQPFFAVVNHAGTHESRAFPTSKRSPAVVDPATVPLPPFYPDTENVRDAVARTYDNIAAMDRWVGRQIAELEEAGLLEETVVVFFSDHGVGLPRGKRSCYDTGTRVPLLVRFPDGRGAGTTDERVVSFVDFGPTMLSLASIEPDARLDGVPFLGEHAREGGGLAFSHADRFDAVYDRVRSVSDGRYRYVRNYLPDVPYLIPNAYRERLPMTADLYALRESGAERPEQWQMAATTRAPEEFYDSEADPWEVCNLIDAPEHRDRLARLRAALDDWIEDTSDLGFVLPETKLRKEKIWPPDGVQPVTRAAEVSWEGGVATIRCADDGASIGYRRAGKGRRPWRVYTAPFAIEVGAEIEVRSHRIGHRPSTVQIRLGERRPNIVFVLADDLGFMDVRPNNPEALYDTPNLDRLSRSGMRFTDGYAACPVCSPTRYSIMTGRYPTRAGLTNYFSGKRAAKFKPAESGDRMALDEITIAEALRGRGYATFFAGKWHLGPTPEFWPEQQGFDVNRGGWMRGGPYGGKKYFSPYGNPRLEDGPDGEHLPDRLASEACRFIEKNKNRPFLTYLSFYSVHTPLIGREDLVQKYRDRIATRRQEGEQEFAEEEQVWPNGKLRRVRVLQRHAVYAAMVEALDQAVGKVLDKLDELGLADDTIVVFTSDNGGLSTSEGSPTSNLPLRGGKGWLYEGGIREPWIVRVPGVTAPGSVCDVPISSIDALPTLLELAGVPSSRRAIDGRSFAPLLRGEQLAERPLFWHYPHYGNQGGFPGAAVRLGDHKLIERFEDGRVHLFDLAADPGERNDLADQQPERTAELRALLHAWYEKHDAQFLRGKGGVEPWRPR